MKPTVGKPIFVLFDKNLAVYLVVSKINPEEYSIEFMGAIAPSFEDLDLNELYFDSETGEWYISQFPESHDVIILSPKILKESIGKGKSECRRIYQRYKSKCPPNLFTFGIPYGQTQEYYQRLINELRACRDNRIVHGHQCSGADPGHLRAIIQANLLLKTAIGASRADPKMTKERFQEEVERFIQGWRADIPVRLDHLLSIPIQVYQDYLLKHVQSLAIPWAQYMGQVYGLFSEPSKEELIYFFAMAHDVYEDKLLNQL